MGKVKAQGVLRHGFFGTYVATIALVFDSADAARDALSVLAADGWKTGKKAECLIWSGSDDAFERVKERLDTFGRTNRPCGYSHCTHQCKDATIDSVNHSIDIGPWFEVEIPCEPTEQLALLSR